MGVVLKTPDTARKAGSTLTGKTSIWRILRSGLLHQVDILSTLLVTVEIRELVEA